MNSTPTVQKRKEPYKGKKEESTQNEGEIELGAKKRKTRVTFKSEMLVGENGIDAIMRVMIRTQFNKSDTDNLNKLVSTYQDWCRELFPKIPYENLIEKISQFGVNKSVQDAVKKYRTEYTEYVRSTSDEAFEEIMSSIHLNDDNNNNNNASGITTNVVADQLNQQKSPDLSPIPDSDIELISPIE